MPNYSQRLQIWCIYPLFQYWNRKNVINSIEIEADLSVIFFIYLFFFTAIALLPCLFNEYIWLSLSDDETSATRPNSNQVAIELVCLDISMTWMPGNVHRGKQFLHNEWELEGEAWNLMGHALYIVSSMSTYRLQFMKYKKMGFKRIAALLLGCFTSRHVLLSHKNSFRVKHQLGYVVFRWFCCTVIRICVLST